MHLCSEILGLLMADLDVSLQKFEGHRGRREFRQNRIKGRLLKYLFLKSGRLYLNSQWGV